MKINYLFIFILFLIILNILFKQSNIENFKNEKKNILIIGGTSGIGKKIIPIFSPDINNVIVVGRKNIKHSNIKSLQYDLSKKDNIDKLYNYIQENFQNIDILVNNFYDSTNSEDINYQFNTNLVNNLIINKKIYTLMKHDSIIINISSGVTSIVDSVDDFIDSYNIIKTAIEKYTKLLASKIYYRKIAVTCLRIDDSYKTNLTKNKLSNNYYKLKEPDELKKCFKYLITQKWSSITGRIFNSSDIINNNPNIHYESNFNPRQNTVLDFINNTDKKISGLNIFGMSNKVKNVIKNNIWNFDKYVSEKGNLRTLISKKYNINENSIIYHNGTIDFLSLILPIFVKNGHNIITPKNSWFAIDEISSKYNINVKLSKMYIKNFIQHIDVDDIINNIDSNTRMICITAPILKLEFDKLYNKLLDYNIPILIDLCYQDFTKDPKYSSIKNLLRNNVIMINTFSKLYSLPGLNLTYTIASKKLNIIIKNITNYPINEFKEQIAFSAINDTTRNDMVIKYYTDEKERIKKMLNDKKFYFSLQNTVKVETNLNEKEIQDKFNSNNIKMDIILNDKMLEFPISHKKINDNIIKLIY